jgi:hypothetical protein
VRTKRQRNALERLALEPIAKNPGPSDDKTAIGGLQFRYPHTFRRKRRHPSTI